MTAPVVLVSSVLAVVLVVALVREIRLRRAMQMLVSKILLRASSETQENPGICSHGASILQRKTLRPRRSADGNTFSASNGLDAAGRARGRRL